MEPIRTKVVNSKVHDYDIYIGRAGQGENGIFGNPAKMVGRDDARRRVDSLRGFLHYFRHRMGLVWNKTWSTQTTWNDRDFQDAVQKLRGKKLGCFCAPMPCHGDVYAAWLDSGPVGLANFEKRLNDFAFRAGITQ